MRKNRIGRELERAFRFIREFGIRGLPFYSRYLLARHGIGSAVQTITLPGLTAPIKLRKATSDPEVFYQVFVFKTYDFSYYQQYSYLESIYQRAVANGERPLIIDCGASIGLSSIWYALRFPKARIYAVEPNKGNFAMLQTNVKAYSNIVPLHAAIWNENARVKIIDESAEAWAFRVEQAAAGDIAAMTVPDIMQHAAATKILLIKIDIEGAEQELFRNNIDWLNSTAAVAIELHDWMLPGAGTSGAFINALAKESYEVVWRGETMFCVKMPPRPSDHQLRSDDARSAATSSSRGMTTVGP
jgi:FkbM family methyltransferase